MLFDARHKLNKHTREQHEGKFVKSSERKSPITELKTNIKMRNSNKQEFNKQDTAEGKVNVKIVTTDVKFFGKITVSSQPISTGKDAAKK